MALLQVRDLTLVIILKLCPVQRYKLLSKSHRHYIRFVKKQQVRSICRREVKPRFVLNVSFLIISCTIFYNVDICVLHLKQLKQEVTLAEGPEFDHLNVTYLLNLWKQC